MAGISINLSGNFSKLDELKAKTAATAASVKKAFASDLGKKMMAGIAVAGAGAFAGVVASMKSAIDAGGQLSDTIARTGADGRSLVILEQMFKNAGVEAGKVPTSINKMQKALAGINEDGEETENAFSKLGLSIEELRNMDPVAAFRAISERIAAIPDPAARAAAAMEVFGKSGGEMLAVMTDSSAWQSARDQVGTYADKLVENAERFDAIGDSVANYENLLKSLGVTAATVVAPALEWLSEAVQAINSGVSFSFSSKLSDSDKNLARGMAEDQQRDDPDYMRSRVDDNKTALDAANKDFWQRKEKEELDAAAKLREEQEKSAAAEAKKNQETEKSKALVAEEYRLEAAIVQAQLQGDGERLAALNREKAIREEMAKLTGGGWDAETARKKATLMVDNRAAADQAEKSRGNRIGSGSLGAFAQSMNVLFGRSANTGLLDENKRQTKLLTEIAAGLRKEPAPVEVNVVPTF